MAVGPNTQAVPHSQLAQEPFPSSQPSSLWQQPSKHITSHSSLHKSTPRHPAKTPQERGKREPTPRGGGRQVVGFPFFFEAPRCHLVLFFAITACWQEDSVARETAVKVHGAAARSQAGKRLLAAGSSARSKAARCHCPPGPPAPCPGGSTKPRSCSCSTRVRS